MNVREKLANVILGGNSLVIRWASLNQFQYFAIPSFAQHLAAGHSLLTLRVDGSHEWLKAKMKKKIIKKIKADIWNLSPHA